MPGLDVITFRSTVHAGFREFHAHLREDPENETCYGPSLIIRNLGLAPDKSEQNNIYCQLDINTGMNTIYYTGNDIVA